MVVPQIFPRSDASMMTDTAECINQQPEDPGRSSQVDAPDPRLADGTVHRSDSIYGATHWRPRTPGTPLEEDYRLEEIQARLYSLTTHLKTRPFYTTSTGDKLKVFISSDMAELYDVRELVARTLVDRGIDAWIHEDHAGARPESVVETSLRAAEVADIYVGLFWRKYGEVTIQEYRHARKLDRPCFIYVRDRSCRREPRLEAFLRAEVYDPHRGVNYDYFDSAVSIGKQVADDIMAWLVRQHREMAAEIHRVRTFQDELAHLWAEVGRLQLSARERSS